MELKFCINCKSYALNPSLNRTNNGIEITHLLPCKFFGRYLLIAPIMELKYAIKEQEKAIEAALNRTNNGIEIAFI